MTPKHVEFINDFYLINRTFILINSYFDKMLQDFIK